MIASCKRDSNAADTFKDSNDDLCSNAIIADSNKLSAQNDPKNGLIMKKLTSNKRLSFFILSTTILIVCAVLIIGKRKCKKNIS